jgi:hypothetical protein
VHLSGVLAPTGYQPSGRIIADDKPPCGAFSNERLPKKRLNRAALDGRLVSRRPST